VTAGGGIVFNMTSVHRDIGAPVTLVSGADATVRPDAM
jgi:hypothetical protein